MDYNEQLKDLFSRLDFINISGLARLISMDVSNLDSYIKGRKKCSEKTYKKILEGLKQCKEILP